MPNLAEKEISCVSIVVPFYNESGNVNVLFDAIATVFKDMSEYDFECVFVNDGSNDGTREELEQLAAHHQCLRVIQLERNYGQSAALIAGLRHATGEYIITLDGDMQNDPADIPAFLRLLREVDFVCGYRYKRLDSFVRRLSSRVANRVRNWILRDGLHDASCGIKGFRKTCVSHIIAFNGIHRFMGAIIKVAGKSVAEYQVNHHPRLHGKSKYGINNRLWRGIYDLVGMAWLLRRYVNPEETSEIPAVSQD